MYRYITHIILTLLIALIIGSALWSPGGILLLDYIATDTQVIPWFQNAWYLFPQITASILGYEWGTKLSFIFILGISAFLGVLIARRVALGLGMGSSAKTMIEILAGVFFLINPFAYERMMVQPVIYLGIILLGYAIYFLYFFEKKDFTLTRAILLGSVMGLALNLFLHASYMIVLILGIYVCFFARARRDIRNIAVVSGAVVFWNLNWILAPLFAIKTSVDSIRAFTLANYEAFQTQALAPLDVWSTNLLLYGFWGERYANHYANVDFLSSMWYIAGGIVLCVSLYGIMKIWKTPNHSPTQMPYQGRRFALSLVLLGLFSLLFGVGGASSLTESLTRFMIEYVPLWQGYREPQKWVGILMIVEGIGWIVGIGYMFSYFGRDIFVRWSIFVTCCLLLLIWSPGPLMGYHGQLRTTVYPESFAQIRSDLLDRAPASKILALPWHSYMGCSWTGRPTISNPIQSLLSPLHVVSSDNIEVGSILYSNSLDTRSKDIERFLSDRQYEILRPYEFTHILFMKGCGTRVSHDWLDTIAECQKVSDDEYIALYACQK